MFNFLTQPDTFAVRSWLLATTLAASVVFAAPTTSQAAGCLDDVSHWGKVAQSKWQAKEAARAGMRWKINNRLGDSVVVHRGTRIRKCRYRNNNWAHGWQCQAAIVINVCQ